MVKIMNNSNSTPEIISDSKYFEPDTVRITICGSQHHGKVWQHSHAFYEFVYVEQGFSLHSYNGKTSVLCGGDLFAIFPGDVHSYNSAYHTHIYNCLFYLEELGDLRSEVLKLPGIDWERRRAAAPLPIIRVGLSERRELVELLEHMRRERENKAVGWELNLKGLLINFLTMYSRLISSLPDHECRQDERGYCGYIYAVLKFVEENYTLATSRARISPSLSVYRRTTYRVSSRPRWR